LADTTQSNAAPDLSRLSSLKDATSLAAKVKQVRDARVKQERDWKLNLAFYRGQQWIWFNRFTGQVQTIPEPDEGDGPRYRVRLTSNQILPGVQGLLAMMTKTKPVITATPDSGSERDIRSAQMAEQLFEHWWRDLRLKAKLQEALLWSILGSAGYWRMTWDPFVGKSMTYLVDPQGQPILDQTLADIFREELQQEGKDPRQFEKTIYMGDIAVDVIPPDSLYVLDPGGSFEDATGIVCKHPMSPDEVKMRYGVDLKPNASVDSWQVPDAVLGMGSSERPDQDVIEVYVGYFKPTPILPKGRYVVFIDDPAKILYDGPWPFPTHNMPFVKFPGPRVPGSTTDEAVVTHARPLQKELNRTISQIVMHKNLTLKPQILAPQGSITQRITDEAGAIIEFMPIGGAIPQWREMPSIPAYVFQHLQDIQQRMDRLFNLQAVTRGDVPPNVEAGIAIDLMQEAAVDQLSPVIQAMEDSLARAGDLMTVLAQRFYTEPRMLKIIGPGGTTKVKRFLGSDIDGGFSFYAEAGSGLPRTRAGRQARIEQLIGMNVLRPDQAWKYLDVADLKGVAAMFAADEEQAYREHDKIVKGQPINVTAYAQAQQQLQQGLNPQTGQPLSPQDNPQDLLVEAGLQPNRYENYQTHLDTHSLYMKSVEFESLDPTVQERFVDHYNFTLQTYLSLPRMPQAAEAVRTTLQLKGTIDPTTASQVLFHSGVPEADAQNLSQPPLDTWVSEDLSEEPVHDSGNTHLDEMEKIQAMQHAEEAHQASQAKTAHDMALAQAKAEHDNALTAQRAAQVAKPSQPSKSQ
jgi:hypothetical protein